MSVISWMTIEDEFHTAAGKSLQDLCNLLNAEISNYVKILNRITTEVAKAGLTTSRYQDYASIVLGLQGQLERLGTMLNATSTNFISDIDAADSYLY